MRRNFICGPIWNGCLQFRLFSVLVNIASVLASLLMSFSILNDRYSNFKTEHLGEAKVISLTPYRKTDLYELLVVLFCFMRIRFVFF